MTRSAVAVCALFLAAGVAAGQEKPSPREEVAREIESLMKKHEVPGVSVAVVNDYKLDWAQAFGVREAGSDEKVDTDTVFQMASVSKPIAGLAVMVLAARKTLDLDADVNTLLKSWKVSANEFTDQEKVTLRLLLGHRAGMTVHGFPGYEGDEKVPTLIQVLDGKPPANTKPIVVDIKPGTKVRYSGGGYCVAQQAVIDVTGKPFPKVMDELVLTPLKMTHSTYEQPLPAKFRGNAATGHRADGKPVPGRYHTYPEMAAAGLWSTPTDLAKVIVAFGNSWAGKPGALLTAEQTKELFATGVGWPERREGDKFMAVHGGANEGYRCLFAVRPATGRGAVVLTNSDKGDQLIWPVLNAINKAYNW